MLVVSLLVASLFPSQSFPRGTTGPSTSFAAPILRHYRRWVLIWSSKPEAGYIRFGRNNSFLIDLRETSGERYQMEATGAYDFSNVDPDFWKAAQVDTKHLCSVDLFYDHDASIKNGVFTESQFQKSVKDTGKPLHDSYYLATGPFLFIGSKDATFVPQELYRNSKKKLNELLQDKNSLVGH